MKRLMCFVVGHRWERFYPDGVQPFGWPKVSVICSRCLAWNETASLLAEAELACDAAKAALRDE
jgi:hypothetical protein